MSIERSSNYESFFVKGQVPYGILCRENKNELYGEMSTQGLAESKP